MCLSKVYMEQKSEDSILVPEAAVLIARGGSVEVKTLFGESTLLDGYVIREVDLMKNYVVLEKRSANDG
ncbi:MAG: CooT family nickel-binding protein [Spirochaetes bacterium]|nr:CooT family nickel-binding protein [Spirochaetota bacterium]